MRKIYSFMLALFATLCVGVAYAEDPVTITINVDNPNAIEVTMTEGYGEIVLSLKAGANEVEIPYNAEYGEYEILSAKAKSGYLVDSLTVSPADAPEWDDYSAWGWGYEFHPTAECDGAVYSFYTTSLNDLRKDSVIFIIDNPSNVQVMYYGSGSINIKEDTSVVYYCGDETVEALQDLPLTVQPTYGKLIYKVFHNDTELKKIESWNGAYYAVETPESGDTVRVLTEAPAGTAAPAILELDSVALEALDSVMVNGTKVELKDTLIVPWGKTVELAFNIEDYEVTVNNSTLSKYSNPYTAVVTDTTVIEANAKKYEKYDVTIILHDYTYFQQLYVNDNYFYPEQDTTVLSMNSKNPRVNIYAAMDCVIDSIKWNNEVKTGSTIECKEEGVLEIWAHKVVREQKFMLYVQRDSMSYASVSSKLYHYFCDYYNPLQADYTECLFSEADDNPINVSISTLSYDKAVCYLNDSILTPGMWGSIEVTLADGDVLKAFADTAEVYTVGIYVIGDAVVENATKDLIVAITDLKKNFDVLQGTEVSFKTAASVLVNGIAAEGADSVYTVIVNENTTIVVGDLTSCAEANVAEANTMLAMDEFVVAYVNGSYTYIQDATGSALIYKSNYGLNAGDTVTGLVGKISVYKNLVEIVPIVSVDKLNVKAGVALEPALQEEVITLADVNKYIRIEGVTVNEADTFTTAGKETINAVWLDNTLMMYNQFKVEQTFSVDSIYDIVCAVSVFGERLQVYLIGAEAVDSKLKPGTTLPLYDFESEASNADWVLLNGVQTNQWVIGNATAYNSGQSLYISYDSINYGYDNNARSIVWAYINTPITGGVNISFDWKGIGESDCDYMRVYLVPVGSIDYVGAGSDQIPYGTLVLGGSFSDYDDWQLYVSDCLSLQEDYYLAFMWRNDGSIGAMPIAIDNVQVQGVSYESYQVSITAGENGSLSTGDWVGTFTDHCDALPIEVCAIPNDHYKFAGWSDGVSNACRSIYPTLDTSIVALFEAKKQYTLVVGVDNISKNMGTVSGSGIFEEGDVVIVTATPSEGYHFVEWSDNGSSIAVREIVLTSDTILFATFAAGDMGGKCGNDLYWTWEDGVLTITGTGEMDLSTHPAWWQYPIDIQSVSLSEAMTSISAYAFYGFCGIYQASYSLKEVIIPANITYIGYGAFAACPQLTKWQYNGTQVELGYYEGYGNDILWGDEAITFLQAPAELVEYRNNNWSNLDTLIVVSGEMEDIPANVTYLDLFNATNTALSLAGREKLRTLFLPNIYTEIADKAFLGCKHLGGITIPANVARIGESAFEDCRSMTSVVFAGNKVETIGDWAFYNCHNLRNLTLPEGVEEVGLAAFFDCTYLSEITIPSTMKKIADNGFAGCEKMQKMYVNALVPPTIEAKTFEDVDRATPVFVPRGTMELYQADPYWSEFFNMAEYEAPTGNLTPAANETNALRKVVRDGQVLILRGDKTYTVLGEMIQ